MKKFFAFILCIILLLSFGAGEEFPSPSSDASTAVTESSTATSITESAITTNTTQNDGFNYDRYLEIVPVSASLYKMESFGFAGDDNVIRISMPDNWNIYRHENSFRIYNGAVKIGEIFSGIMEEDGSFAVVEYADAMIKGTFVTFSVLAYPKEKNEDEQFKLCLTYTYFKDGEDRSVSLCINYKEANTRTTSVLTNNFSVEDGFFDDCIGSLKLSGDGPKKILVLGNSFVNTSKIGTFLQEMFAGTNYTVEAYSKGYASISRNSWESFLPDMLNGCYDIIFMCGFYAEADVTEFRTYINACEQSGTELVIFPAHNESHPSLAISTYPNVDVLHWQKEINMLMSELGIDKWDFCIDDVHKHSTPLAGYVGAHMIYRAITGEIPKTTSHSAMHFEEIEKLLGAYVSQGGVSPYGYVWMFK